MHVAQAKAKHHRRTDIDGQSYLYVALMDKVIFMLAPQKCDYQNVWLPSPRQTETRQSDSSRCLKMCIIIMNFN